ncbi:hypothetical protein BKA81DRAFT_1805 [Phyllosticta paracitricarpa]
MAALEQALTRMKHKGAGKPRDGEGQAGFAGDGSWCRSEAGQGRGWVLWKRCALGCRCRWSGKVRWRSEDIDMTSGQPATRLFHVMHARSRVSCDGLGNYSRLQRLTIDTGVVRLLYPSLPSKPDQTRPEQREGVGHVSGRKLGSAHASRKKQPAVVCPCSAPSYL